MPPSSPFRDVLVGSALSDLQVGRSLKAGSKNGDVRVLTGEGSETALARLGYSFSVGGEYYAGYCLEKMFDSSLSARKYIAESKGAKIFVRYDPQNPNRSVWRRRDQPPVMSRN